MKNYFNLISLLLLNVAAMFPVAGGLALYRFTQKNGLEFLLVQDPYQRHSWRQGFEFPAGTIGDYGHRTQDGIDEKKIDSLPLIEKKELPMVTFLKGSVREALEELVYVPAKHFVSESVYNSSGRIDKKISKRAIDSVAEDITKQGFICLRNVSQKFNYYIFCWDVTKFKSYSFLSDIIHQRSQLTSGFFSRPGVIGAEPDTFAWVPATELAKVIDQTHQTEANLVKVVGVYSVLASEYIKQGGSLKTDQYITLSPAFVELISKDDTTVNKASAGKVLSMRAIIAALNKK